MRGRSGPGWAGSGNRRQNRHPQVLAGDSSPQGSAPGPSILR